jgi:hypothetical protein
MADNMFEQVRLAIQQACPIGFTVTEAQANGMARAVFEAMREPNE